MTDFVAFVEPRERKAFTRLVSQPSAWWALVGGQAVVLHAVFRYPCPFKALTGWDCPACGGTRALFSLMHGRVVDALHYNFAACVFGIGLIGLAMLRRFGLSTPPWWQRSLLSRYPLVTMIVLAVGWTVFRNLPAFSWFSTHWATR